jgi:RNA polymerase sigma-70 factor (ECF subfamily)
MAQDDAMLRPNQPARVAVDWPVVLAEHKRWLRTVLLARLGDPSAVDDVLQEVQLAALAKGGQLRDASKAAPWLYRVAVASALEYRRRQRRRCKLIERYAEQHLADDEPMQPADPLDWLMVNERQSLVRQALTRLPGRESEILLLKYTEDWTYRQIADHLGISAGAVEARLHRARKRMRHVLTTLDSSFVASVSAQ